MLGRHGQPSTHQASSTLTPASSCCNNTCGHQGSKSPSSPLWAQQYSPAEDHEPSGSSCHRKRRISEQRVKDGEHAPVGAGPQNMTCASD